MSSNLTSNPNPTHPSSDSSQDPASPYHVNFSENSTNALGFWSNISSLELWKCNVKVGGERDKKERAV
ncbi:hypothetical protein Lal_00002361 [Lupinus albus]|nr:hypothetical protein Lal_00002361 [Lupinus albus]